MKRGCCTFFLVQQPRVVKNLFCGGGAVLGKGLRCALEQQNVSFTRAFALRRQTLFRAQDDTQGAGLGERCFGQPARKTGCVMIR